MFIGGFSPFALQIIVVNFSHHILGKGQVGSHLIAFEAITCKGIPCTIHSVGNNRRSRLIIISCNQAPAARLIFLGTAISQTNDVTVIIAVSIFGKKDIFITFQVHTGKIQLASGIISANRPNFIVTIQAKIFKFNVLGLKVGSRQIEVAPSPAQLRLVERISNGSIRIIVPAKITFTGHFP